MQDKRKDLTSSKQKQLITEIVQALSESHPSMYYLSTVEIANHVKDYISDSGKLSIDEQALVKDLDMREIQMLMSLH